MPITSPSDSYRRSILDYLPVTGFIRAAGKILRSEDNPNRETVMDLVTHGLYTALFSGFLIAYSISGIQTGQWNPLKQPSAIVQRNEEIKRQKREDEEGRIQGREDLLRLMIQDNDLNGNGSLDKGIEQDTFIKNASRSDF